MPRTSISLATIATVAALALVVPSGVASHSTSATYFLNGDHHAVTGIFVEGLGGVSFAPFAGETRIIVLPDDDTAGNLVALDLCQAPIGATACLAHATVCENGALALANDHDPVRVVVWDRPFLHGCPLGVAVATGGTLTAIFR